MQTVKTMVAEAGEECEVDVDVLYETLTKLPAEMFIELFHKMQMKIYGYPAFLGVNNGCGGCATDEKTED